MTGIVETKEAVLAVAKLVKFVIAQAKDGIDLKDVGVLVEKLVKDEAFRQVFLDAFSSAQSIPAEIKDISFQEGIELVMAVVGEFKQA